MLKNYRDNVNGKTVYALIENTQHADLSMLRQQYAVDINVLPADFETNDCSLIVMDMDSTLITIECIDEIADFMDLKPQVAAITEAAMRGEIDFETSLKQRVALLEGLPVDMLDRVYNERLMLNSGGRINVKNRATGRNKNRTGFRWIYFFY